MKKQYLTILVLFCIVTVPVSAFSENNRVFNEFLYSNDIGSKEQAFRHIIKNRNKFKKIIFEELRKYSHDLDMIQNVPNDLIYIAGMLRDSSYLPPLLKIIQTNNYSEHSCIYACPIVFSLTLFECFSDFQIPIDLNQELIAIRDLYHDIKYVKRRSFLIDNTINFASDKLQDIQRKTERINNSALIKQAGPKTKNYYHRFIALNILANKIIDDKTLIDLYWLAITEAEDASAQYRSEAYRAILKAEYYRSTK